ncbi:hypothetical protein HZS_6676 [Henneguya salminicola]|nr:hypothetical protein HZS_6676 [Henneguya salminicola]
MASKLDVLKRYTSKKKKKINKNTKTNNCNLEIYDEGHLVKKTYNSDIPNVAQDFESIDILDEDENPPLYMEDGVTPVPINLFNKMSDVKGKWVPIGDKISSNPHETQIHPKITPGLRIRHDSDSEPEPSEPNNQKLSETDEDLSPVRRKPNITTSDRHEPSFSLEKSKSILTAKIISQKSVDANKADNNPQINSEIKWGPGSYQAKEKKQIIEQMAYEMAKPLARYKDDVDLEKHLKSIVRDEDPLKNFVEKTESSNYRENLQNCKHQ